jgi:hypothetical protein
MPKDPSSYEALPIPELGGLTLLQARSIATTVRSTIDTLKQSFSAPLVQYTTDERSTKAAQAGFSDEEELAFQATLDAADAGKGYLSDLADLDHGQDPAVFEVDLQRARLDTYKVLRATGEEVLKFGYGLIDTAISTALLARDVESNAYDLLKGLSRYNPTIKSLLAPALDFFRKRSLRRPRAVAASNE